jgi:hypothetical protein
MLHVLSTGHARTFVLGALAGGLLFGGGLMLGGAGKGRPGHGHGHGGAPDAHFDRLTARHLDIVDRRGRVVMRLRGNHDDGGNLRVFDRSGDVRVELRADGSMRTYGGNERLRALVGRDPRGWGDRRGGVVELFDTHGRLTTRLPTKEHPGGCGCDVCAAPGHGHGHGHDGYREPGACEDERHRPGWRWRRGGDE